MNQVPKSLINSIKYRMKEPIASHVIDFRDEDELEKTKYISMYPITDILIQNVGRFCESYNSDLLIDIATITDAIKNDTEGFFVIGVRDSGVDGNCYTFINLQQKEYLVNQYYRKIYAVTFSKTKAKAYYDRTVRVHVNLYNITNDLRLDLSDKEESSEFIDYTVTEWSKDYATFLTRMLFDKLEYTREELKDSNIELSDEEVSEIINRFNNNEDKNDVLTDIIKKKGLRTPYE